MQLRREDTQMPKISPSPIINKQNKPHPYILQYLFSEQLMLKHVFLSICCFQDIRGRRSEVLAPCIPYNLPYTLNHECNIYRV